MPIPSPAPNQEEDSFISSCMSSEVMKKDYKDQKQRYAVCKSQFDRKKKKNTASVTDIKWDEGEASRVSIE